MQLNIKASHHPQNLSGIFLLYEGLPPTIIESQVLSHVRAMDKAGIHIEVWAFSLKSKTYAEAQENIARFIRDFSVTIRIFKGVSPSFPCSDRLNGLLLFWLMWKHAARPIFVHARTERAAAIAAFCKHFRPYRLIWDARGDSLSELKTEAPSRGLTWSWCIYAMKEWITSRRLKVAAQTCDSAIFVSDGLRHLQGPLLALDKTLIVPCVADEQLFYYSPELRAEVRSAFNYLDQDRVILYAGSTAPWQCIPETVALIETALRGHPAFNALIVTPNIPIFDATFSPELRPRIRLVSGTLKDMNRFLHAADFGVLLRKRDAINKVASPVKFAEYSLTGLTVICSDAVEQVVEIGRELCNTINAETFFSVFVTSGSTPPDRVRIASLAQQLLGRKKYIDVMARFYSKP